MHGGRPVSPAVSLSYSALVYKTKYKGLRALSDFEHEFQMALINHKLNPGLDTMFLTTEHQFMYLSSSIVKEMAHYGADLHGFVPDAIIDDVTARMTGKNKGGL